MMTRFHAILAGALALAAMVTSCSVEREDPEVDITTIRCSIPQLDVEEDFATGLLDTLSATRASFSGASFLWDEGDKIGIVPTSGAQIYFSVSDGAGTSTARFDGGDWAMKSTGTFFAYYPLYPDIFLSKDHVSVSYAGQTQNGNNNNLHTGGYWTLYTEGTKAVGNALNFSFNHLTAFFKTYVTVPAGTYTKITFSAPGEIFIKDGYFDLGAQTPAIVGTTFTDELCLDLQNVTFTEEAELTGYLVVAPVDIAGVPITVTVYKDGQAAYEYTLTKTNPMVAATTYAFRATALSEIAPSVDQANALFAAGATSVTIAEPLTEDATVVLPNTTEAVTLTLPTTASTSTLTVAYAQDATAFPATLSISGPEGSNLDIYAPNSTVTVNGISYNHITSRTAANTCIISEGVSVNVLKVVLGGVLVYGTVSQIDLSEQEDDAIVYATGTVAALLGEDDEEYTSASGVSINKSSINLTVGAAETLTATVLPMGAYPDVIWTSSDETVATVSADGVVTAVAEGSATITVTTISEGFTASCVVTVTMPISDPLTITSIGSTSVSIKAQGSPYDINLEYRISFGEWAAYTIGSDIALGDGESVQFRAGRDGNANFVKSDYVDHYDYYYLNVSGSGNIEASGNIMSLLDGSMQRRDLPDYGFYKFFSGCLKLVNASNLKLPATSLSKYCYYALFGGCIGLTSAPELPATTLAPCCYASMFSNCTKLASAPELPATTLATMCYDRMFSYCSKLTVAPELPATALAGGCYNGMFECTGLITAPELPATTLASNCYRYMFSSCTKLISAPELSATTLAEDCYSFMFMGCTELTSAPELPAMTMADGCYSGMFDGCTGLTVAPELPATTLAAECYQFMFAGCTSLISMPVLPATTLAYQCYGSMFSGCQNLRFIQIWATNPSSTNLYMWVDGVGPTGTFIKNPSANWSYGISGIPAGWTVRDPYEAVDLGLPSGLKWANMNIGATNPQGLGNKYAWGEIAPKSNYSWDNYKYGCYDSYDNDYHWLFKYCTKELYGIVDGKTVLEQSDDAAFFNCGAGWRIPRLHELEELCANCTWTWTTLGGVNGYTVIGPNGNSIFLPLTGEYDGFGGVAGVYWSSDLDTDWYDDSAGCLHFGNGWYTTVNNISYDRALGECIRPVR